MFVRRMRFGPIGWYPVRKAACEEILATWERDLPRAANPPRPTVACIVPHAGWAYSGRTAYATIAAIPQADTVVLLGNDHHARARRPVLIAEGGWETPFGEVAIDVEIAKRLVEQKAAVADPGPHAEEHSVEMQMPMIARRFPGARVVPLLVPGTDDAAPLGEAVARAAEHAGKRVAVVGTTDLTHYGGNYGFTPAGEGPEAIAWMRENDASIIGVMKRLAVEDVFGEVERKGNACGPGPIVATLAYARARGSRGGVEVHYTTSHDEAPDRGGPFIAVGYVGMLF